MQGKVLSTLLVNKTQDPIHYGQCLLQMLQPNKLVHHVSVDFKYYRVEGKFSIWQSNSGLINLSHGAHCPCLDKKYQSDQPKTISVAVSAIIKDSNNNFLLTRRCQQMRAFAKAWVFPGGMVDYGQDLKDEVKREIKEEVGIDINSYTHDISPLFLYESIYPTVLQAYPQKQTLVLFYTIALNETQENIKIILSQDEVDQYEWVEEEEIKKIINSQSNKYLNIQGIYPNQIGEGIGEGHFRALQQLFEFR